MALPALRSDYGLLNGLRGGRFLLKSCCGLRQDRVDVGAPHEEMEKAEEGHNY
jgi:hypothetical protein